MMDVNVFQSEKERDEARQQLPDLMNHPAWKFLVRVFDLNIQLLTAQLKSREDFSDLDEIYRLQDRISELESFRTLPQTLLSDLPTDEDDDDGDDTYDAAPTPPPDEDEEADSQPS